MTSPNTGERRIPLHTRRLALRAGIGDLTYRKPCHGYANGCTCGCKAGGKKKRPAPRQPWETKAA